MGVKKEEFKIRSLTRKDRKTVTKIFRVLIESLERADLAGVISSFATAENSGGSESDTSGKMVEMCIKAIKDGSETLGSYLEDWFADLLGVSVEEFDNMPLDIELQIFEQLRAAPEAVGFFTRAWALAKQTKWFEKVSERVKTKLDTISES